MSRQPLEVWKFGGASLKDGRAIQRVAARVATHDGPLVVVASALAGVTDLLLEATPEAAERVHRMHRDAARTLGGPGPGRRRLLTRIDESLSEFSDLCAAIAVIGHRSARVQDALVSRGERLSAMLLTTAITAAGRSRVTLVDALELIDTDDAHGDATPRLSETRRRARKVVAPLVASGGTVVVPGFLGRAPDGGLTTMGRGDPTSPPRSSLVRWAPDGSSCGRMCAGS